MINEIRRAAGHLFPLKISRAKSENSELVIGGDNWSLGALAAWRVIDAGTLVYGWSDEVASTRAQDLIGDSIADIVPQSDRMLGDPALRLASGRWIEIFSDHPVDPWVLSLPGMIYVGSPCDPHYNR